MLCLKFDKKMFCITDHTKTFLRNETMETNFKKLLTRDSSWSTLNQTLLYKEKILYNDNHRCMIKLLCKAMMKQSRLQRKFNKNKADEKGRLISIMKICANIFEVSGLMTKSNH